MCYHVECIKTNFLFLFSLNFVIKQILEIFPQKKTSPIYIRKKILFFLV